MRPNNVVRRQSVNVQQLGQRDINMIRSELCAHFHRMRRPNAQQLTRLGTTATAVSCRHCLVGILV